MSELLPVRDPVLSRPVRHVFFGLLLLVSVAGCEKRVQVRAMPEAARVSLPGGRVLRTPATIRVAFSPFAPVEVMVEAPNHRSVVVDLRAGRRFEEILVVLVPNHGPAGAWTLDDAP